MIDLGLTIQPVFPLWVIIVLIMVAFGWLILREYKRKIKFLGGRIVAVVLLTISILGLLLQPSLIKERKSNGLVLLTPHYQSSVADSLQKLNSDLIFIRTSDAVPFNDADIITSTYQSNDFQFVLGDGLPAYALPETSTHFQYLKSEIPYGIIEWRLPYLLKVNQRNDINGVFHATGKSLIKLIGPDGLNDSITFLTKGIHSFKLSFTPTQAGLFLYSVQVKNGSEITTQKFPVQVEAEKKLKILLSVNYPTAEIKYLKNYLIEKNHSLVARFQISKNNFRYEYNNQPTRPIKFSSEILNDFDLLIVDNESIEALSLIERNQLQNAINQGLGIVVLYNSINEKGNGTFLSIPMKNFKYDTAQIQIASSRLVLSTLPVSIDLTDVEAIITNRDRILSGYINKELGKIAFQLLQETYRLQLEGKSNEYALLWSPIIEKAARTQNFKSNIEIEQPFPMYPDEPININVLTTLPRVSLTSDNSLLPMREDIVIDDYWHTTTWAGSVGWHKLTTQQDSMLTNYYVSNSSEWQSLRIAKQQQLNEIFSSKEMNKTSNVSIESKPLPLLIFFLTFMVAAGFLWLAPKL